MYFESYQYYKTGCRGYLYLQQYEQEVIAYRKRKNILDKNKRLCDAFTASRELRSRLIKLKRKDLVFVPIFTKHNGSYYLQFTQGNQ